MQVLVAPGGVLATVHVGDAAGLGPLLVQVTVPVAVLPAGGLAGKPLTEATMSACGATGSVCCALLFGATGSGVVVVVVALIVTVPVAGAVKFTWQVIA